MRLPGITNRTYQARGGRWFTEVAGLGSDGSVTIETDGDTENETKDKMINCLADLLVKREVEILGEGEDD
jgi:hypothetical protein